MDIGAILIGFAVLVLCTPWLVRPFLKERLWASDGGWELVIPSKGQNVKEQRQNILSALRDLDFDFQIGKVSEEDHRNLRAQLLAEAASLTPGQDEDDEIETMIRARREELANTAKCSQCGERLSAADRFCPNCGAPGEIAAGKAGLYCPACGSKTVPGALFCSKCGARLADQAGLTEN